MLNKTEILQPESTYHIYNRANGSEKLFVSEENYQYFLQKYREYIHPIADTFCYCLMPNHFHFLVRIKSEKELLNILAAFPKAGANLTGFDVESSVVNRAAADLTGFENLEGL